MRLFRVTVVVSLIALAAPADEKKAENLIVNGGFEDGPEAGDFKPLDKGATDIKGWTVTRGQIDYVGTHWKHAAGDRSLDLHGSPGFGGVQQTCKTTKGKKYRVTFAMAGNPAGQNPKKKLGVRAAGKEAEFTFDATGKTMTDMGWVTKSWEFAAAGDETTLEFFTLMTDDSSWGPALDEVSVVEVKE